MKRKPSDDRPRPVPAAPDEVPQVFAVVRSGAGFGLSRRALLGTLAVGAAAAGACKGKSAPPDDTVRGGLVAPDMCVGWRAHPRLQALAFVGAGQTLVSAADDVKVWALPQAILKTTISPRHGDVTALAGGPDGTHVAAGFADGTVQWLALTDGAKGVGLPEHPAPIGALAVSRDGRQLASASEDGTVRLVDLPSGKELKALQNHRHAVNALAFSTDGRWLASGSFFGRVRLWSLPEATLAKTIEGEPGFVRALAFSADGRWLAAGGDDHQVRLFALPDVAPGPVLTGHKEGVTLVALDPAGRWLVSAGAKDSTRMWVLPGGALFKGLDAGRLAAMAVSPNGDRLATGGDDGSIRLWRMPLGEPLGCLFDPATEEPTEMRRSRAIGGSVCACDTVLTHPHLDAPDGATCACDTVMVGTRPRSGSEDPTGGGQVGGSRRERWGGGSHSSGGHYWRPN